MCDVGFTRPESVAERGSDVHAVTRPRSKSRPDAAVRRRVEGIDRRTSRSLDCSASNLVIDFLGERVLQVPKQVIAGA